MELILDIGNSTITSAFFRDDKIIDISSIKHFRRTDEVSQEFIRSIDLILGYSIDKIAIASVAPEMTELYGRCITSNTAVKPYIITHDSFPDIRSRYQDIKELGIDRLCNVAYAVEKYRDSVIVIDIGTALTFEIIGPEGYFEGGMILPGIDLSSKALSSNTSLLPEIEKKGIDYIIGKNTIECISSGIINGLASTCDNLIYKIEKDLKTKMKVILTGGDSKLISDKLEKDHETVENTVILGAKIIYSNQH
ncbi:MAG: type III pantothenate kinase [Candidatus Delongbacteria bacterium]|nr:type III pantothenate kinase [Candidatus Delongbacteria bacterium]